MGSNKPEWYATWSDSPYEKPTFTTEHMRAIEQKVAKRVKPRLLWTPVVGVIAIVVVLALMSLLLIQPGIVGTVADRVSAWWSSEEKAPDVLPFVEPETTQDLQQQPELQPEVVQQEIQYPRFFARSSACVFLSPDSVWGPFCVFTTDTNTAYELIEEQDEFAYIRSGTEEGWVPSWYLKTDGGEGNILEVDRYSMVVGEEADVALYPGAGGRLMIEGFLTSGRVVLVEREYGDWYGVDFFPFEFMAGDKWVRKDALVPYSDALAKEGYVWNNKFGVRIYDEQLNPAQYVGYPLQNVTVHGERGEFYEIRAPGGIYGYIRQEDFLPNPWNPLTEIGLAANVPMESWLMENVYGKYSVTHEDALLEGAKPLDLFKMYVHAALVGDAKTQFALVIKDGDMVPEQYRGMDELPGAGIPEELILSDEWIDRFALTVMEEEVVSEREALVRPSSSANRDWTFHLVKDNKGFWKVAWPPLQE